MSDINLQNERHPEDAFNEQERAEIRELIEEVAGENRLPVNDDALSLSDVPRGWLLPIGVAAAVVILVAGTVFGLSRTFSQQEAAIREQAGSYVSVEGRLVRELRRAQRREISAKESEIEQVRAQLAELEDEQNRLEQSIEERIAEREEEIRAQLRQELEAERSRLIAEGLGDEELEARIEAFEAERRAFYEQQLEEYREELEEERIELETRIAGLRSQYQGQIRELEAERGELVDEFRRREAELQAQLEERTQTAAAGPGLSTAEIGSAREELSDLRRRREQEDAVRRQVAGQVERIRDALAEDRLEGALDQVDALIAFLNEDSVRDLDTIASRRESDLFFLSQLRETLLERLDESETAAEDAPSQELALLDDLEILAVELRDAGEPAAQADIIGEMVETISILAGDEEAPAGTRELLDAAASGEGPNVEELEQQIADYEDALSLAQEEIEALEADARNTEEELSRRIAELETVQESVSRARDRYLAYLAAVDSARGAGDTDATLVARQEMTSFLESGPVSEIFEGLDAEVIALFSATQNQATGAALADAAEVVQSIISQPTREAQLGLLQFELENAEGDDALTEILTALRDALEGS